jgi:hypothetical protein
VSAYGVNKYKRKIALTIGLLCSKTFTYDGQRQVLADHGIDIADVVKINIKGRYMVWTRDGGYHEIPLKLFHPHTRPGCKLCPDFAAQHADISTGGIGADDNWTLTIVRTERGEEWIRGAGLIDDRVRTTRSRSKPCPAAGPPSSCRRGTGPRVAMNLLRTGRPAATTLARGRERPSRVPERSARQPPGDGEPGGWSSANREAPVKDQLWKAAVTLAAVGAGIAARNAATAAWTRRTGHEPPANPADPATGWGEAIGWTVATGVLVGVARLIARRGAAAAWAKLDGELPPGLVDDGASAA